MIQRKKLFGGTILLVLAVGCLLLYNYGRFYDAETKIESSKGVPNNKDFPSERCNCHGFNFCFRPNSTRFSCNSIPILMELYKIPTYLEKENSTETVVFVTAASSNHFEELKAAIASTQNTFPTNPIIVYDMGLKGKHVSELKTFCRVERRQFSFTKYAKVLPSVRNLFQYRWKPLIVARMLSEYERVWWMDTSVRWKASAPNTTHSLPRRIREGEKAPLLVTDPTFHSLYAATDHSIYNFFPADYEMLRKTMMLGGGLMYLQRHPDTLEILKWLLLCALEEGCMSPKGSQLICSFPNWDLYNYYGNCHRFDQSIINLLVAAKYGYGNSSAATHDVTLATSLTYRLEFVADIHRFPEPNLKPLANCNSMSATYITLLSLGFWSIIILVFMCYNFRSKSVTEYILPLPADRTVISFVDDVV